MEPCSVNLAAFTSRFIKTCGGAHRPYPASGRTNPSKRISTLQLARGHHGLHDLITQLTAGRAGADVEGYIVILEIREIRNVIDVSATERNSP